ncbi:MAG: electron transport complex subunit RsxB [Pseudomonadota bacterium]
MPRPEKIDLVSELAQLIDDALPQTQCTRCGYPDCKSYAQAIASQQAPINQCPPGGQEGIERLARLTGAPVAPLNPENGVEGPLTLAVIDENWCIGCTLCLDACPTDAIVGTHKRMHTVIEPYCTGCELCIPVCPVDCISLENISDHKTGWAAWSSAQAQQAQSRYQLRTQRLKRQQAEHTAAKAAEAEHKLAHLADHSKIKDPDALERKRAIIETALARARSARQGSES